MTDHRLSLSNASALIRGGFRSLPRFALPGLVLVATVMAAGCGRDAQTVNEPSAPKTAQAVAGDAAEPANAVTARTGGRWFIASANPLATDAGADILARGGSAVDAAIATQAVLGLVEPQSSGLGGGAFMLHFNPTDGTFVTYDGREVAPASATPDRFLKEDGTPMGFREAVSGGLSIGVPGVVRMLELAHAEHGILPWAEPWRAAADLAETGFAISPRLHGLIERFYFLKQSPAAAAYFYDADGNPHPGGVYPQKPGLCRDGAYHRN